MTVALESEIVATAYDAATGNCYYTIERDGKRWTTFVHQDDFQMIGLSQATIRQRRDMLAQKLEAVVRGPPDPVAEPGERAGPWSDPMPERATVTWKPEWFEAAREVAHQHDATVAENQNGYLCFLVDGWLIPIVFEGIDVTAADADAQASTRIREALNA